MRGIPGVIIILTLLFLAGTVAAAGIPDRISISGNKLYLVAGNDEQATITAIVTNISSATPVAGARVEFAVNDSVFGSFSPATAVTDTNGVATSSFTAGTRSGIPTLQGVVVSTGVVSRISQKIDHNKAYTAKFSHPLEGEVNTTVPFAISFFDYYGNPIDQIVNPNQTHLISLHIYGPAPNDCYFVGSGHDIPYQTLDQYGNVSVSVKLTSAAGPNAVTMDQFELIPPPAQRIITAVSSDVASMQSTVSPSSPPGVPADGNSTFLITYLLLDKFRNPVGQQDMWVNTSLGESNKFTTDNLGHVIIGYGKKAEWGYVTINGTSVINPLANVTDVVQFTSTEPTTMVLSANPEVMASRDALSTANSHITATISTDSGGVPSTAEQVTFTLGADSYPGGPFNATNRSSFSATSVMTSITAPMDPDTGDATVVFYPGSFSTKTTDFHYSATSSGQVTVTATWTSTVDGTTTKRDIVVKWKNYPYLSAKTSLNPDKIKVNETVDVSVLLAADGWALQPIPIDTMLVLDRSGSMAYDNPTRISQAKTASSTFVDQMSSARDRVGLVSFSSSTTTDQALTSNFATVKTKINSMSATGATQLRYAMYTGLKNVATNGRANAVKAIIVVTDGEWNYDGNPLGMGNGFPSSTSYLSWSGDAPSFNSYQYYSDLGGGTSRTSYVGVPNGDDTWDSSRGIYVAATTNRNVAHYESAEFTAQNLSVYAKNNGIRIYAITFAYQPVSDCTNALKIMANSTGGFYAYAPDGAALTALYTKIAGELKDTAGVDTAMSTDFTNVNVTDVTFPGADVFNYVYQMPISTATTFRNLTYTNTSYLDQSADWAADNKLNFTIGTMKVGDTWQATFRLKAKKSGSVDVFGSRSILIFNNSGTRETLVLPHTYLTVTAEDVNAISPAQIKVIGFCAEPNPNSHLRTVQWITTYTGGPTRIYEVVSYKDETGADIPFYRNDYVVPGDVSNTHYTTFNLNSVPKGQTYSINVRLYTDTPLDNSAVACDGASDDTSGQAFIRLD